MHTRKSGSNSSLLSNMMADTRVDWLLEDISLQIRIYSGVISIRSLRLAIFLAKLNNLEVWGADIGNAYLEAKTKEKLYIVAGPEFEELEGHILVIYKALYGLKSSGLRWSQKIHDIHGLLTLQS